MKFEYIIGYIYQEIYILKISIINIENDNCTIALL